MEIFNAWVGVAERGRRRGLQTGGELGRVIVPISRRRGDDLRGRLPTARVLMAALQLVGRDNRGPNERLSFPFPDGALGWRSTVNVPPAVLFSVPAMAVLLVSYSRK